MGVLCPIGGVAGRESFPRFHVPRFRGLRFHASTLLHFRVLKGAGGQGDKRELHYPLPRFRGASSSFDVSTFPCFNAFEPSHFHASALPHPLLPRFRVSVLLNHVFTLPHFPALTFPRFRAMKRSGCLVTRSGCLVTRSGCLVTRRASNMQDINARFLK